MVCRAIPAYLRLLGARVTIRRRLGVSLPPPSERATDGIPVEVDHLERYAVGDRLLTARLGGADAHRCIEVERARGALPPGALADPLLEEVTATVEALVEAGGEHARPGADRDSLEIVLTLPRFDPTGPLPTGVAVLEASAGTGKTYTIAGLVARYVADGAARHCTGRCRQPRDHRRPCQTG